jgi:hypothetical protein
LYTTNPTRTGLALNQGLQLYWEKIYRLINSTALDALNVVPSLCESCSVDGQSFRGLSITSCYQAVKWNKLKKIKITANTHKNKRREVTG